MAFFLLGIPWLATAIGTFLTATIGFFASFLTRRLAIIAAVITVVISITTAFIAALEGLISGISYVAPDLSGVFAILPGNFSVCVSAIITTKMLAWAYSWNITLAQMKLF